LNWSIARLTIFWKSQTTTGNSILSFLHTDLGIRVSPVKNTHPSAYLQDVVAFLTTVVRTALQNLPQNIKTFVYFDALDHLATSLKVPRHCDLKKI